MDTQSLNLARKWRSKNFDEIVGQELPVKMLKNSLYLNHFFPVYLFSGQKGCGKTSTARVFAKAINCSQLEFFQKDPRNIVLPCLACDSCNALALGRHPDFIEIDAASNTGVDNVRHIIDSSALLPLMGRKKIYLIDEAHMLSKAAFNAFLKLMEEPPANVIFILATTDVQKIIETVRSRCFQLFFKPVQDMPLFNHLSRICITENIPFEPEALKIIIKETQGSIRDALNVLEQVRFSDIRVSKQAVYKVLGHLDDERVLHLFTILLHKPPIDLLLFLKEHSLEECSAEFLWHRISQLLRACIWLKSGVNTPLFIEHTAQLQECIKTIPLKRMSALLELFYTNEAAFQKTTAQHTFLEMILLRICQKNETNNNSSMPTIATPVMPLVTELEATNEEDNYQEDEDVPTTDEEALLWAKLVVTIEVLKDPLLESIFKQGTLLSYNSTQRTLAVDFPKELTFFSDIIQTTQEQWQPLFEHILKVKVSIVATFTKTVPQKATPVNHKEVKTQEVSIRPAAVTSSAKKVYPKTSLRFSLQEKKVDVSNTTQWPLANLLLQHFPGTITQVRDIA